MPKIDAGSSDSGTRESGEFRVTFAGVANDVIEARDERPAALKILFKAPGSEATVNYAIPLNEEARARLKPFTVGEPTTFTEKALRKFVAENAKDGPFYVRTWGDYIQAFKADVGKHVGYLSDLRLTKKGNRMWFTLIDLEGFESDFPAPWEMETRRGKTGAEDYIGGVDENGKKLLKSGKGPFPYLTMLGLDWGRWLEELESAPALWPGHYNDDLVPLQSYLEIGEGFPPKHDQWCYFGDMDDITPELVDATVRHGLKPVKWNVIDDPKYGIGVERGDYFFDLVEVEIVGGGGPSAPSAEEQDFAREAAEFSALADRMTQRVSGRTDVRFMVGTQFTEQGRDVGVHVIKPLITLFPEAVRQVREDGAPIIKLPPTSDLWKLNGLVCLNLTFQRLLALDDGEFLMVVNLTDPSSLYAFANENVPEWSGAGYEEEGGELL